MRAAGTDSQPAVVAEELAEVLIDLEAEPALRLGVMEALKDSVKR